ADGAGGRAGQVRQLDRAAANGGEPPAGELRVCAFQLAHARHDRSPAMNARLPPEVLRQHLIDPEVCIRCNTCEETCPIAAITHDGNHYVVDPDICNGCMACVPPCPTGSIDN